ncbi:MAG: transposase [Deltaproteobacteria bacterium]|nr:MAG: transposase [Deltaproteobacteria bacterium]
MFQEEFRTEDACYKWLLQTRWPNGFRCPRCDKSKYTNYNSKKV